MSVVHNLKNGTLVEKIDIPVGLINYFEKRTRRTNPITKKKYSVTDIIGCQRKSFYKISEIEEEKLLNDANIETMWDSIRGDLLHQITYAYKWREMDIDYDVILRDGIVATIVGRL